MWCVFWVILMAFYMKDGYAAGHLSPMRFWCLSAKRQQTMQWYHKLYSTHFAGWVWSCILAQQYGPAQWIWSSFLLPQDQAFWLYSRDQHIKYDKGFCCHNIFSPQHGPVQWIWSSFLLQPTWSSILALQYGPAQWIFSSFLLPHDQAFWLHCMN